LSTAEPACYSTPEESGLRVQTLPFDQIPHQSRLFLDYLKDPVALRQFYPSAVRFHHELPQRVPEVLGAYRVDREKVCNALEAMNTRWGAGEATIDNIRLLRESDCVAVVSGQQAGLFTGPLYTIYKALSAVKLAGCLRQRNTKAVPVFWIAADDHDLGEVNHTFARTPAGELLRLRLLGRPRWHASPCAGFCSSRRRTRRGPRRAAGCGTTSSCPRASSWTSRPARSRAAGLPTSTAR